MRFSYVTRMSPRKRWRWPTEGSHLRERCASVLIPASLPGWNKAPVTFLD